VAKRKSKAQLLARKRWLERGLALAALSTPAAIEYIRAELKRVCAALPAKYRCSELDILKNRLKAYEERLELHRNYAKGAYVEQIGIKPTTPCCIVEDKQVRMLLRKAAIAKLGPKPPGAYACHRCDVRKCYALDHLFWGTPSDNMRDCLLKQRRSKQMYRPEAVTKLEQRIAALKTRIEGIESR
jgi:hypothetical protein